VPSGYSLQIDIKRRENKLKSLTEEFKNLIPYLIFPLDKKERE
jgi:hypothetical protein